MATVDYQQKTFSDLPHIDAGGSADLWEAAWAQLSKLPPNTSVEQYFADAWRAEAIRRLGLVAKQLGCEFSPEASNLEFMVEMAVRLFPAPAKKGRRIAWSDRVRSELVFEVEALITRGMTPTKACRELANDIKWARLVTPTVAGLSGGPAEALLSRYYRSLKSKTVMANVRFLHKLAEASKKPTTP